MEPNAIASVRRSHPPYLLFGGSSHGIHEYHLYCELTPDEVIELVTPDGDVVGRWPSDLGRTSAVQIASGNRLFFDRPDLTIRVGRRDSG